jgi:hypothetical protein
MNSNFRRRNMTVTVTKREAQAMIDQARNRIIERMLDRYDVQGAVDNARDRIIAAFYDLEQQRTRINAVQHEQTSRRLTTMDNRMRALEAEIIGAHPDVIAVAQSANANCRPNTSSDQQWQ